MVGEGSRRMDEPSSKIVQDGEPIPSGICDQRSGDRVILAPWLFSRGGRVVFK